MSKHKTVPLSSIAANLPEELSFRKFIAAYLNAVATGTVLAVPVEGTFQKGERVIKEDLVLDTPEYRAWYEDLVSTARLTQQRTGLIVDRATAEASDADDLEALARRYQHQVNQRKAVRSLKPKPRKAGTRPKLPRTKDDTHAQPESEATAPARNPDLTSSHEAPADA